MTYLDRVAFEGHVYIKVRKHSKYCTGLQGNVICGRMDS